VVEGVEVEVCAELAVDAQQEVQIERRRDAFAVVVGGIEDLGILFIPVCFLFRNSQPVGSEL